MKRQWEQWEQSGNSEKGRKMRCFPIFLYCLLIPVPSSHSNTPFCLCGAHTPGSPSPVSDVRAQWQQGDRVTVGTGNSRRKMPLFLGKYGTKRCSHWVGTRDSLRGV